MAALEDILHRLEPVLGARNGEPVPLEGGITNRNYRVRFDGGDYVVRRHGRDTSLLGIDRESERLAAQAAAQLGIAPALAAVLDDAMACEYVPATPLAAGQLAARAEDAARALRAFHDSEVRLSRRFRVDRLVADYGTVMRERGAREPEGYARLAALAQRIVGALGDHEPRPCHNDLLPGNILVARDSGRIVIVDWEYAGMGDPRFDLGNLAVNNDFDEAAERRLLGAYDGAPPDVRRHAELKLARVLSDVREAAWGMLQGAISDLDFDFAGYAREHLQRLEGAVAQPRFEDWLDRAHG